MESRGKTIFYGLAEEVGLRAGMEDKHAIYDFPDKEFFSAEIYDGHGGPQAAAYACEMLTPIFIHNLEVERQQHEQDRSAPADLLRDAYLATDRFITERTFEAGTTAATMYLFGDGFIAANAGDTRIVIGTAGGAEVLTVDHRPGLSAEKRRVEKAGGRVIIRGVPRVEGILAVSRSLGDGLLKAFISPEPRIVEGYLGRDNDYVLLACDGVWDVLEPEEAMAGVRGAGNPESAAETVKKMAVGHGSTDNITVLVLDIRAYVKDFSREKMEILRIKD
jgi:protein phosphatase 1L